jgi:hypothetical protein
MSAAPNPDLSKLSGMQLAVAVRNDNLRRQFVDAMNQIGKYQRRRDENETWHLSYERCYASLEKLGQDLKNATGEDVVIPCYVPRYEGAEFRRIT